MSVDEIILKINIFVESDYFLLLYNYIMLTMFSDRQSQSNYDFLIHITFRVPATKLWRITYLHLSIYSQTSTHTTTEESKCPRITLDPFKVFTMIVIATQANNHFVSAAMRAATHSSSLPR